MRPEQSTSLVAAQEVPAADVLGRHDARRSLTTRPASWARRLDWTLIVSPAVTLAVMLWGITAHPYWADEADTVSAVSRTVPQLIRLLGHVDAVHGLYYLMLWPLVQVAGHAELVTRLPSALAMVAAAAGVTAIGRRLVSRRAGLYAGLLFAVLPTISVQGQNARPYAMITAAAVLASYLLLRIVQEPRRRWFVAYGLALVLVGYMQLFGLLLVLAHAVTLAALSRWWQVPAGQQPVDLRGLRRGWLLTVVAAGVAAAPVTIVSYTQRAQVAWIPGPGWRDASNVAATLFAGWLPAAVVIGALVLFGLLVETRAGRWTASPRLRALARPWLRSGSPGRSAALAWLAVPWLVLPPLALIAASLIMPVYFSRYVTFCVPAAALLAGAGLAAMRWHARAAALVLAAVFLAPIQLVQRSPGGGMRTVAQFLSTHERPGDAIVYPNGLISPWWIAYPQGFAQLRDISLAQTPAVAGRLYGTTVPVRVQEQREQDVSRIWIVPLHSSRDPASYLAPDFRLARTWVLNGNQKVLLYVKAG